MNDEKIALEVEKRMTDGLVFFTCGCIAKLPVLQETPWATTIRLNRTLAQMNYDLGWWNIRRYTSVCSRHRIMIPCLSAEIRSELDRNPSRGYPYVPCWRQISGEHIEWQEWDAQLREA